ncbi:MAG TPA: ATP-binding protein, partial [Spirochaetes bacterium]|nr:ATP-binding protein [Spirochaetota bacterium]
MLIQFSVENYLSFKQRETLNMVASSDQSLDNNVNKNVQDTDMNLLKSVGIYGANGSGKSNLIKALDFMRDFVLKSSKEGQIDSSIDVRPFKLDQSLLAEPSTFDIVFLWEGVRYQYGFSVNRKEVCSEWFFSYPKKQSRRLFERNKDWKDFKFGDWSGQKKKLVELTRPNALFISVASQFNQKLASIVVQWFEEKLVVIPDWNVIYQAYIGKLLAGFLHGSEMKPFFTGFLKQADMGILDFKIQKVPIEPDRKDKMEELFHYLTKKKLPKVDLMDYQIKTFHTGQDERGNEISVPFDFNEESDGTQKLFALSLPILRTFMVKGCLVIDELDVQLHPLLMKFIIEHIHHHDPGGQLIFTTHDSHLLNPKLFRRDQIYFTEKSREGATSLYSLWDFKSRKG